jgi:ABC-type polar amino acid transport system ATPase subunit
MIRTEKLTKRYRHNEALHGLTLEVSRGQEIASPIAGNRSLTGRPLGPAH